MKRFLPLCLAVALVLSGCASREPVSSGSAGSPADLSSSVREESGTADSPVVSGVTEPLDGDFSMETLPEELPELFEENGLYGFRSPDGSVLVPAQYQAGKAFSGQGPGELRLDDGDSVTWYIVGLDGTLLDGVSACSYLQTSGGTVLVANRNREDYSGVDWQLFDLDLNPILPEWAEFLWHESSLSQPNRIFLTLPGGDAAEFLPEERALMRFEPGGDGTEQWDLAEAQVLAVSGAVLAGEDAHSWGEPEDPPLAALEQAEATLRTADGETVPVRLKLEPHPVYGDSAYVVTAYAGDGRVFDSSERWIALFGPADSWPDARAAEDPAALLEFTGEYRSAQGLDGLPMEVAEALWVGPEDGDRGVLICLETVLPADTVYDADSHTHSALLWYPDADDPRTWEVLSQSDLVGARAMMTAHYTLAGVYCTPAGEVRALAGSSGYEGSPGWESFPLTGM